MERRGTAKKGTRWNSNENIIIKRKEEENNERKIAHYSRYDVGLFGSVVKFLA